VTGFMPNNGHLLVGARAILWDLAIDPHTDPDGRGFIETQLRVAMQLLDDVLVGMPVMRMDGSPASYQVS
jgi:hypothetical protein